MFWSLKKKRQEYVEERLEPYYQKQFEAYNQRRAQHEESENKAEEVFNLQSQKCCEERKQHLTSLIAGTDTVSIKKEISRVPGIISFSFPCQMNASLDGMTIAVDLSLPRPHPCRTRDREHPLQPADVLYK